MGMPALAMTDHGNVFGAYDFCKQAKAAGVKPIIGMEAYLAPGTQPVRAHPGALGRRRRGRRLRRRRVHPHDAAGREHRRACTTCSGSPRLASLEGYYYKPRDGPRAARRSTARASSRTTGCPSGEVRPAAAAGRTTSAPSGRRRSTATSSARTTSSRADGPRPRHRAPASARTCSGSPRSSTCRCVATNDLHYTYADGRRRARGAAVRAVRQDDGRPEPVQVRRAATSTSRSPAEMRDALARAARGLRQHAADRRAVRRRRSPRAPT